jgi:hypothetical protein
VACPDGVLAGLIRRSAGTTPVIFLPVNTNVHFVIVGPGDLP